MPAPREFTESQRAHLKELVRRLGVENVRIDGYDLANRPVVWRRDKRGVAVYAIQKGGAGVQPPASPVLEFTIDDAYAMPSIDYHLLVDLRAVEEE